MTSSWSLPLDDGSTLLNGLVDKDAVSGVAIGVVSVLCWRTP